MRRSGAKPPSSPTFTLWPASIVVDAERTVRHALFPVVDIPHAVDESLRLAAACARP